MVRTKQRQSCQKLELFRERYMLMCNSVRQYRYEKFLQDSNGSKDYFNFLFLNKWKQKNRNLFLKKIGLQ